MKCMNRKIVAILMIVCMIACFPSTNAYAELSSEISKNNQHDLNDCIINDSSNDNQNRVAKSIKANSKLLDYIDCEEFESNEFVSRLENEEDLNTYVFQNSDGSKSVYYLAEDVKYKDNSGNVVEKDIKLVKGDKGYNTTRNNVFLNLPFDIQEGVKVGLDDFALSFRPVNGKHSTSELSENSITYSKVFGEKIDLKYTPLLSGIKEDIILREYITDANFSFTIDARGLNLFEKDGEYYFAEKADSDIVFKMGNVIVYDQNSKPCTGDLLFEKNEEEGTFTLTISVDDAYLSADDTVYPVTIDPSVTINCGTISGKKYIADAPIFQGHPTQNYGNYIYNSIGTPNSSYGKARTCVKTPAFITNSAFAAFSVEHIISVLFYVKDSSGSAHGYIKLYPMSTSWDESSVTWNAVNSSYISQYDYGNVMGGAQWTAFNITPIAKKWKTGQLSSDAGFIFINQNESSQKSFFSSEHSTTASRPYILFKFSTSAGTAPNENGQNKDDWCWAASSKMVGEHNGGTGALPTGAQNLTYTDYLHQYGGFYFSGLNSSGGKTADAGQRYLVKTIKSDDHDYTGGTSDKEQALQLSSLSTMSIGTKYNPITTDLPFLKTELNSGRWVVASTIPSAGSSSVYVGHSIVINYYNSSSMIWGMWDPWDDTNYYFFESAFVSETIKLKADPSVNRKVRWYHYCK